MPKKGAGGVQYLNTIAFKLSVLDTKKSMSNLIILITFFQSYLRKYFRIYILLLRCWNKEGKKYHETIPIGRPPDRVAAVWALHRPHLDPHNVRVVADDVWAWGKGVKKIVASANTWKDRHLALEWAKTGVVLQVWVRKWFASQLLYFLIFLTPVNIILN